MCADFQSEKSKAYLAITNAKDQLKASREETEQPKKKPKNVIKFRLFSHLLVSGMAESDLHRLSPLLVVPQDIVSFTPILYAVAFGTEFSLTVDCSLKCLNCSAQ